MKLEEVAKSHELRQEEADKDLSRRKDWLAFRVFVGLLGLIAISSLVVVLIPWFSDDARKWATLSLTTILSLIVGYLVGKAQK